MRSISQIGHRFSLAALLSVVAFVLLLWSNRNAADQLTAAGVEQARQVFATTGIHTGLCVVVEHGDGELAAGLTNGGRMVVQSLFLEDAKVQAARKRLQARQLYGLASAERATGLPALPYADNLVNLLIADLDALGNRGPGREEILRVLAPRGVAYLKEKGIWASTVKPLPKGTDDWSHFYHGPDGNPVSQDEAVGPPTGLQWLAGVQCTSADPVTGYRLAGGRALYEWEAPTADRKTAPRSYLICRDAYSGVVLWSKATTVRPFKTRPLVMTADRVYVHLEVDGRLVALDARHGEVVRTYDQGGRVDRKLAGGRSDVNLVYHDGALIQTAGNSVYVLDAKTGDLRWKHSEPEGRFLDYPTVAAATGQVYFTTGLSARDVGRYPGADTRAVLAFDLASGKSQWRCELGHELSQLSLADGALIAYNLAGFIGRKRDLYIARLRPADGKVLWKVEPEYKGQLLDMAVVNGKIYLMSLALQVYDVADGKLLGSHPMPGNSRCEMSRASKNYLLMSFGNFLDLSKQPLQLQRCEISRGTCGSGNTPAYGMLFYSPNRCQCFVSVRGYLAAAREAIREPVADDRRLEMRQLPLANAKVPQAWPAADEWPIYLGNPARGSSTPTGVPAKLSLRWKAAVQSAPARDAGPIVTDLFQSSHFNGPVSAPVIAGGRVFVAVPEAHRVEALDAGTGKKLWDYTAGGRVDTPPTLYGGLCLFGCRDGRVYALDSATGELRWRFLAAPYERGMVAHNQVESTWPLFGSVAVADGVLVVAAGRHPETNGGIHAYGLDPATGRMLWKRTIRHERAPGLLGGKIPDDGPTTRRYGYNANTVLNEILVSDGKLVSMTGLILEPRTGEVANRAWPKKLPDKPQTLPEHPMDFYLDLGFRPPYRNQQLEAYGGPGADHGSWLFRLAKPKLEVHGELIAFTKDRVAVTRVAGIDWAMWDLTGELPGAGGPGRQNSSHPPTWSAPRGTFKGMDVKAVVFAGDKLVLGLSSPRKPQGASTGEVRILSAKDAMPLREIALDSGPIQAGLAAASGRLYVTCDDGSVRSFGE
ncbi:MAG: PQQ-binding-like beta-propeller repeat protein [Planctomycetia bacterium]|nr:PQQ-binding-like beta-propeller repeat protein [Planctomycetia bacterium]